MNKLGKYVNALFLGAAALSWLISQHYIGILIGYFQLNRKLGGATDVLQHVLPLLIAAATFVALRKNQTSLSFTTDAVEELTRVSWPTTKEVRLGTIVVIVTVVVAGLVLGLIDLGFTAVIRAILSA